MMATLGPATLAARDAFVSINRQSIALTTIKSGGSPYFRMIRLVVRNPISPDQDAERLSLEYPAWCETARYFLTANTAPPR